MSDVIRLVCPACDRSRSKRIAGKLVQAAVDDIRSQDGEVRATCSYAVRWLEKHSC